MKRNASTVMPGNGPEKNRRGVPWTGGEMVPGTGAISFDRDTWFDLDSRVASFVRGISTYSRSGKGNRVSRSRSRCEGAPNVGREKGSRFTRVRNASLNGCRSRGRLLFFGNDACRVQRRTRTEDRPEIGRKKGSSLVFFTGYAFERYCRMSSSAGRKDIRYKMVTLDRTIEQEIPGARIIGYRFC